MDFRSNALTKPGRFTARLITLLALVVLVAQFLVTMEARPQDGLLDVAWHLLRYFTILTSCLTLLTFLGMIAMGRTAHRLWLGGLTLWEAMTGGIYHVLLTEDRGGMAFWADQGLHSALPVAVLVWWLAFAPKYRLRPAATLAWLVWPGLYITYALMRGARDGIYPYFFLDPGQVRWDGVLVWSGMLGLAFVAGGLVLILLARIFRR